MASKTPKFGVRSLSLEAKEYRDEIQSEMFDGAITDSGSGKIPVEDAARFAADKVDEARENWESDNAHRLEAPNLDALRIQEATKRTTVRWRYGSLMFVASLALVALAGLTATGHA